MKFSKKQKTIIVLVDILFIFLVLTGVFLSRNVKATYSADTQQCYECEKNLGGGNYDYIYAKADDANQAATLTGGANCQVTDMNYCNLKCFACNLGVGTEHALQLDAATAAEATTGTNCREVEYSTCSNLPIQCYECRDGGTRYVLGTDHCDACGQGSTNFTIVAMSNCDSGTPTDECYSCTLGQGNEYAYAESASEAASLTGGTNCTTVTNTNNCDSPPRACYKCTSGSTTRYTYANGHIAAGTSTGIDNCSIVTDTSNCEPDRCYSCDLGQGKEYTYAKTASAAATNTGGTNCSVMTDTSKCDNPPRACYSCDVGTNGKRYTYANDRASAATTTGGTNCSIITDTTNCEPNRCYSCDLGEGKEYTYAKTASAAATSTGGTNCSVMTDTSKCDNPPQVCYACSVGGTMKYTKARSCESAASGTGGTGCQIVDISSCADVVVQENCYECELTLPLNGGKYYTLSDQDLTSSMGYDNTTCSVVSESVCTTSRCYKCVDQINDDTNKEYLMATTISNAKNKSGKNTCFVADESYCNETPSSNPKTGVSIMIIVWIIGIVALLYPIYYATKLSKLK